MRAVLLSVALVTLLSVPGVFGLHGLDLQANANQQAHNTDHFLSGAALIVRRGQWWRMTISLNGDATALDENNVAIHLRDQGNTNQNVDCHFGHNNGNTIPVVCRVAGTFRVGRYVLLVNSGGHDIAGAAQVIVLFNPFRASDPEVDLDVHNNPNDAQDLILDEIGYTRDAAGPGYTTWNLRQSWILDYIFDFIENFNGVEAGRMTSDDPRAASAYQFSDWWNFVLQHDQTDPVNRPGLLQGYWSRPADPSNAAFNLDIAGGNSIAPWNNRNMWRIFLRQAALRPAPHKYGQCMVYGNLLTAILRAVGIPSRPVKVFNACLPEKSSQNPHAVVRRNFHVIDPNTPVAGSPTRRWSNSFHVWTEIKMRTWGGHGAPEWHAADPSFRISPTRLADVLTNNMGANIPHTGDFVETMKAPRWLLDVAYDQNNPAHDARQAANFNGVGQVGLLAAIGLGTPSPKFNRDYCATGGAHAGALGKLASGAFDNIASYKTAAGKRRDPFGHHFLELNSHLRRSGRLEAKNSVHPPRALSPLERMRFAAPYHSSTAVFHVAFEPAGGKIVAGEPLEFSVSRNDATFYLDAPMQIKVVVLSTVYDGTDLDVVKSFDPVDFDLKKPNSKDEKSPKASFKLAATDYAKYLAISEYFRVSVVFFEKGKKPAVDYELQEDRKKNSADNKGGDTAKTQKKEDGISFAVSESFQIHLPPVVVLPQKADAKADTYLKAYADIQSAKDAKDRAEKFKSFDPSIKVGKDGTPIMEKKFSAVAFWPNTLGIPMTKCFATVERADQEDPKSKKESASRTAVKDIPAKEGAFTIEIKDLVPLQKARAGTHVMVLVSLDCAEVHVSGAFDYRISEDKPIVTPENDEIEKFAKEIVEKAKEKAKNKNGKPADPQPAKGGVSAKPKKD